MKALQNLPLQDYGGSLPNWAILVGTTGNVLVQVKSVQPVKFSGICWQLFLFEQLGSSEKNSAIAHSVYWRCQPSGEDLPVGNLLGISRLQSLEVLQPMLGCGRWGWRDRKDPSTVPSSSNLRSKSVTFNAQINVSLKKKVLGKNHFTFPSLSFDYASLTDYSLRMNILLGRGWDFSERKKKLPLPQPKTMLLR